MDERVRNPIHESRLLGSIVLAIWGGGDENEARQAALMAVRQLINYTADDLPDVRGVFTSAQAKASQQPNSDEKLKDIWEKAAEQNKDFLGISYDTLMGKTTTKKKATTKKKTTKKKTTRRKTARTCQMDDCETGSYGRPLCRRHYYEAIGRLYIEVCQREGCRQESYGRPLCRTHYYEGRGRRRRRRRPRRPSLTVPEASGK